MSGKVRRKKLIDETRCLGIRIDITVPIDAFDTEPLARLISLEDSVDPAESSLTGPLRTGGRGKDEFLIVGHTALHKTKQHPHYHIWITASASTEGIRRDASIPKVTDFLRAIAKGDFNQSAEVYVSGSHRYPRESWKRNDNLNLPVPLSAPGAGDGVVANLTGLVISYQTGDLTETVSIVSAGGDFTISTDFRLNRVTPELFQEAVEHSAGLGYRLFHQQVEGGRDE